MYYSSWVYTMPIRISDSVNEAGDRLIKSDLYITVFTNPIYVGLLIAIIIILIAMVVYVDDSASSLIKFTIYSCLISVVIQNLHSGALKKHDSYSEENQEKMRQLERIANPSAIVGQGQAPINREDFIGTLGADDNSAEWAWES